MKKNISLILPFIAKLALAILFVVGVCNSYLTITVVSLLVLLAAEVFFYLIKKEKHAETTLDQMLENITYQFPMIVCVFGLVLAGVANYWILVAYVVMYVVISLIYYYLHLVSVRTVTNHTLHLAVIPFYLGIALSIVNSLTYFNGALDPYTLVLFILGIMIYAVGFAFFVVKYARYFKFRRKIKEHKAPKTK